MSKLTGNQFNHPRSKPNKVLGAIVLAALMSGCAQIRHSQTEGDGFARVEDDFGASQREMREIQESPIQMTDLVGEELGAFDGNKGGRVLEQYRQDYAVPKDVKQDITVKLEK